MIYHETYIVYLSDLLRTDPRFSTTCENLIAILEDHDVSFGFIPETKDIWARDYMPIQVSKDKYVSYQYRPDYLQTKHYQKLQSDPQVICEAMGLKTVQTDLIIDGGNVIKGKKCVFMTDKVLDENKLFSKDEILEELKTLFEVQEVVLLPWDKNEEYGHIDGMLRVIDDNTVLINGYFEYYPKAFKNKLFGALEKAGVEWKTLSYDVPKQDPRNWSYINYLQTDKVIVVPSYGIPEDEQAVEQLATYFPKYKGAVVALDMTAVVKHGGALNCITWTLEQN